MNRSAARPPRRELPASLTGLSQWLDSRFRIPFIGWRIGLDGLVGLIPGVGDAATAALSAYIVLEGWRLGVRKRTLARMAGNAGLDLLLGSVPLIGDLFDIAWKANVRNIELIRRDLADRAR